MSFKKKIKRAKESLLYSLHTNPMKTLRNIILVSGLIASVLTAFIVGLISLNAKSAAIILEKNAVISAKEMTIKEKEKVIQEKDKKINELKQVLPIYYSTPPQSKLNQMKPEQAKKVIQLSEAVKRENLKTVQDSRKLLTAKSPEEVKPLMKKYGLNSLDDKEEIIKKAHPIPVKLALAQAVVETGLGSDKVGKAANNWWGIMDVKHPNKVQRFPSIEAAVARYFEVHNSSRVLEAARNARLYSGGTNLFAIARGLQNTYCKTPNFDYAKEIMKASRMF